MNLSRIHPDDLALLADLVADRLAERLSRVAEPEILTAQQVAERYGVAAAWVRENATDLGALRLGDGPRPRLRFDAATVAQAMKRRSERNASEEPDRRAPARVSRRPADGRSGKGLDSLPIRELQPRPIDKVGPGGVGAPRGLAHPEVPG